MVAFLKPVAINNTPHSLVHTYGKLKQIPTSPDIFSGAIDTACKMGANPQYICVMKPANGPDKDWFQKISRDQFNPKNASERSAADGAIVTRNSSAIIIPTGDCAVLVLSNTKKRRMGVFHVGREAAKSFTPCVDCFTNIVSLGIRGVLGESDPAHLHAYITGSICAEHFPHDSPDGQEKVRHFKEKFGHKLFKGDPAEGKLDIPKLIKLQLLGYRIPDNQIVHDGLCTFAHPNLSSHRETGSKTRNITIAVNKMWNSNDNV